MRLDWLARLVFLVFALTGSGTCAPSESALQPVARYDSAGIEVVVNQAPISPDPMWCIEVPPSTEIGAIDGPRGHDLHQAWAATRLSDGRVAVGDTGSGEVRFFSSDGHFLSSFGRKGEGPGEFRAISVLRALAHDTLFVFDRWSRRVTVLSPTGGISREVTLEEFHYPNRPAWAAPDPNGGFWASSFVSSRSPESGLRPTGPYRNTSIILHYSDNGDLEGQVYSFPGSEGYMPREGDGALGVTPLFNRDGFVAVGSGRVFAGTNDDLTYVEIGPSRRVERVVRDPVLSIPLSEQEVEEAASELTERAQTRPLRYPVDAFFREDGLPDLRPAYERLVTDSEGGVWAGPYRRTRSAENAWTVFDSTGRPLGVVRVPHRLQILEVGSDYVLGRLTDDLGIEYIRVHELHRHIPSDNKCY